MGLVLMLTEQLKAAMKQGETKRRDVIRFLQSALKNAALDARVPVTELSDDAVHAVIRRLVKQRKDGIAQYEAGGRKDLVENETEEMAILMEFLPAEMPEGEVRELVSAALLECRAVSRKDLGKAMGAAMRKVDGRASGDTVKRLVEEALPEEA